MTKDMPALITGMRFVVTQPTIRQSRILYTVSIYSVEQFALKGENLLGIPRKYRKIKER